MRLTLEMPSEPVPEDPKAQRGFIGRLMALLNVLFTRLTNALNGQLTFGDGTDLDNVKGKWINYTSNGTPDSEDTVTHNAGSVPVGYIVTETDKAASIYKGTTAWTTTAIYLKANVATVTAKLFLLLPPD